MSGLSITIYLLIYPSRCRHNSVMPLAEITHNSVNPKHLTALHAQAGARMRAAPPPINLPEQLGFGPSAMIKRDARLTRGEGEREGGTTMLCVARNE